MSRHQSSRLKAKESGLCTQVACFLFFNPLLSHLFVKVCVCVCLFLVTAASRCTVSPAARSLTGHPGQLLPPLGFSLAPLRSGTVGGTFVGLCINAL